MIFVAVVPATFIAIVLAAYFLLLRYADAEKGLIDRSHSLIKLLTPAAEYGVFSGNREELHQLATALARAPDMKTVIIYDRGGNPLAQVGTPGLAADPKSLGDGWSGRSADGAIQAFHAKIWRSALPINDPLTWSGNAPAGRESIGSITLEFSRAGILAAKREMMAVALIAGLVTLALVGLLALRLARDVSAPILSLQRVVERIRRGHLETRVAHHPARTLRSLEDGVNEMAAALQAGRDQLESRIAAATAELRQKKDEAEQASIAKSRFLAATSHDLRQPLHALFLFSADLVGKADGPPMRRLAGQISAAVDSLGKLLDGLLDISRIDLGAIQPGLQPLSLNALLERVVAEHCDSARAKGLVLRLHPTSSWVVSDPVLLHRMVGNLVANAVRYTEQGRILVGARRAADLVRIEVWDTGIGIAEEQQPLVFREFFQAANPERDAGKGLGLGLSLVERLSRLLDHPICMRSAPGKGSMFGITLPRGAPDSKASGAAVPAPPGGFDARLLVVGTNEGLWPPLCKQLASWGCQVMHARSAAEAAIPSDEPPDLVLCEGRDCVEVLSRLESPAAAHPPALILIGDADACAGAEPCSVRIMRLTKPVQPAKLRALMQHLLEEDRRSFPDACSAV